MQVLLLAKNSQGHDSLICLDNWEALLPASVIIIANIHSACSMCQEFFYVFLH